MNTVIWITFVVYCLGEAYLFHFTKANASSDKVFDDNTQKQSLSLAIASYLLAIALSRTDVGSLEFDFNVMGFLALVFMLAGMLVRTVSVITLRQFFTVQVAIRQGHKIIDAGLYRYVRHPSYLGIFLFTFGFALSLNNLFSIIILVGGVFFGIEKRVKQEEKVLVKHFGSSYKDYRKRTKRYLLGLY